MLVLNIPISLILLSGLVNCERFRDGVFENVTVFVKNRGEDIHTIFINFDDNLAKYLNDFSSPDVIIIRDNFIPKLEINFISNISKVCNLSLINNGIREVSAGAFNNLPTLKVLNLSFNHIEEIKTGVFNNLPMEDLYLHDNKIARIGYKAFSNLRIRNLYLNNNRISRWSKDWLEGSTVLLLNMGFNLIQELPPKTFQLMNKPDTGNMSIIFSNNQIKKIINNTFFGVDNYNSIHLDGNLLRQLDAGAFHGVKTIKTLNMNNNLLSDIDINLFNNIQLEILMLENNKLRCISTEIFHMDELDIDDNPISCYCVQSWLKWRDTHSNPSIYHITNLEENCI